MDLLDFDDENIPQQPQRVLNNCQEKNIKNKKKLTDYLISEVQCIICLQVPDQLYNTQCCQQYICIQCNNKNLKCACEKDYQIFNNKCAQKILDYIICECQNEKCNFQSSFLKVIKHQNSCEFQMHSCEECKQNYFEKDIINHLLTNHKELILKKHTKKIQKD
ncbi:hypothetical protein ABPG72_011315 [Tetrahymena utriculariae]